MPSSLSRKKLYLSLPFKKWSHVICHFHEDVSTGQLNDRRLCSAVAKRRHRSAEKATHVRRRGIHHFAMPFPKRRFSSGQDWPFSMKLKYRYHPIHHPLLFCSYGVLWIFLYGFAFRTSPLLTLSLFKAALKGVLPHGTLHADFPHAFAPLPRQLLPEHRNLPLRDCVRRHVTRRFPYLRARRSAVALGSSRGSCWFCDQV